jgi:hypothetical protein
MATKEQYVGDLKRRYVQRLDGFWYQQFAILPSGTLRAKAETFTEQDFENNYDAGIAEGYIPLVSGGWFDPVAAGVPKA